MTENKGRKGPFCGLNLSRSEPFAFRKRSKFTRGPLWNDSSKDELFLKVRKFSWEVHHQTTLLTVSSFPLAFSFPPDVSVWRICWGRGDGVGGRGDDRKKDAKMTSQSITFCFSNIDSKFPFFCTVKEVHRRRQNLVKTSATFVIYCRLTATWNPRLNWKLHILKGRHHSRICSIVST